MILQFVFWFSIFVLMVVPLLFVVHNVYKDGVVGRGALLCISFWSATFPIDKLMGSANYAIMPQIVFLIAAFAVFLVWHLWRFHHRVLNYDRRGKYPEGCPLEKRSGADRRFTSEGAHENNQHWKSVAEAAHLRMETRERNFWPHSLGVLTALLAVIAFVLALANRIHP